MSAPPRAKTLGSEAEAAMAFKPNYRFERAERNRAKEQKKQAKLLRKQENADRRKPEDEEPTAVVGEAPDNP